MQGSPPRRSVNVEHLLGIPWSRMHCGQLAYTVLHDVLGIDVREHDLWIDTESEGLEGRVEEYLATQRDRWTLIGTDSDAAREIGDVLWSRGLPEYGLNHLSVVVALDPVPTVISTTRASGPFLQRASANRHVLGVYRFTG